MSAHDELLKIHTILQAPGNCPDISDGDTLTVRRSYDVKHSVKPSGTNGASLGLMDVESGADYDSITHV